MSSWFQLLLTSYRPKGLLAGRSNLFSKFIAKLFSSLDFFRQGAPLAGIARQKLHPACRDRVFQFLFRTAGPAIGSKAAAFLSVSFMPLRYIMKAPMVGIITQFCVGEPTRIAFAVRTSLMMAAFCSLV